MRLAVSGGHDDAFLIFARQLGATDVIGSPRIPTDRAYFDFRELMLYRTRIEDAGLRWAVMESYPAEWSDKIKLGLPGRDEQIDNWCRTLRNMGSAGINVLGYFWSLRNNAGFYGLRTSRTTRGRGDAIVTTFDYDRIKDAGGDYWGPAVSESLEITDDQMWDNVTYFLQAVIPVAEEAGVKMGLHPDDPPVSPIAGVPRIFRSHDALKRFIDIVPSDCNGLAFCQGTISEMAGNVIDAINYFGRRDKIFYVHFRNVTGTVREFSETFIDEGHVDMLEAMLAYKDVGFDGAMVDDHVPHLVVDSERQHSSHAYALGYMKALIDTATGPFGSRIQ